MMSERLLRPVPQRGRARRALISAGWSAALDFGTGCICVVLSELCHRKRDLVLKGKGPHLRTTVQGKSPFSLRKAFLTVSSEKKSTSLSDSPEALWQDAEYGNK